MSNYDDVYKFHEKFGLLTGTKPRKLTKRKLLERLQFQFEELLEFAKGCGISVHARDSRGGIPLSSKTLSFTQHPDNIMPQDIDEQADALIDLVYVAMGTAVMMGLPWQQLWDDVQRANMSKVRGMTKRGHAIDVTKPEGWVGPKTEEILNLYGYDPTAPEVDDEI